ncbi:Lissencephaly-1, partial [Coemansia sp. RSA 2618]
MVLATASEDITMKIWDSESGNFEHMLKDHTKAMQDMAFDAKGTSLMTCSADLTQCMWDVADKYKCIQMLHSHNHCVSAVCIVSTDKIASALHDKMVKIWELATRYCVKMLLGHLDWVHSMGISSDVNLLCMVSNNQN